MHGVKNNAAWSQTNNYRALWEAGMVRLKCVVKRSIA